jgi:diadenosine tetraphosphate (Ap4A) HIT family hydrolase
MTALTCPFCSARLRERIMLKNELAFAVYDINPVTKGHTLIIPFRHVGDFFETTPEEQAAFLELAGRLRELLDMRYHPSGYNLGVNIGRDAGQAIMHVHLHLIPRYPGDARGQGTGMRHVVPRVRVRQERLSDYDSEPGL